MLVCIKRGSSVWNWVTGHWSNKLDKTSAGRHLPCALYPPFGQFLPEARDKRSVTVDGRAEPDENKGSHPLGYRNLMRPHPTAGTKKPGDWGNPAFDLGPKFPAPWEGVKFADGCRVFVVAAFVWIPERSPMPRPRCSRQRTEPPRTAPTAP